MAEELKALFESIGLDAKTATEVTANSKVSAVLKEVIAEAGMEKGCDKSIGNLLYMTATKVCGLPSAVSCSITVYWRSLDPSPSRSTPETPWCTGSSLSAT